MAVTAKVKVTGKSSPLSKGEQGIYFSADYDDGRNKEWAPFTPSLSISMTVKAEVAENFEVGQAYTLTFTPEEDSE